MILDTSAVVAILVRETGHEILVAKLVDLTPAGIGAPTLAESAIVLSARLGHDARGMLARFLQEADIGIVPFGETHYSAAVDAWLRFGKGRHAAALNFGDCMAYATARLADEPLLCVGNDFRRTDLKLA